MTAAREAVLARKKLAGAALNKSLAHKKRLRSNRDRQAARIATLRADRHRDKQARSELEAALSALEGAALAEGREADSREVAKLEGAIKNVDRRLRASEAGEERLQAEVAVFDNEIAEAKRAHTNVVLEYVRVIRDDSANHTRKKIAELAPYFASMIATDEIRKVLVGDQYAFDAIRHPPAELWSGTVAARTLLDAIPTQLVPPGLRAEIESGVQQILAATLGEVQKGAGGDD